MLAAGAIRRWQRHSVKVHASHLAFRVRQGAVIEDFHYSAYNDRHASDVRWLMPYSKSILRPADVFTYDSQAT
jgi:hypothetical protein